MSDNEFKALARMLKQNNEVELFSIAINSKDDVIDIYAQRKVASLIPEILDKSSNIRITEHTKHMKSTPRSSSSRGRKTSPIPLPERKQIYLAKQKEKTKEKREKAREDKLDGEKMSERVMAFFIAIKESLHLSWSQIAKQSGYSQQAISWIITNDDAKFDVIFNILNSLGFQLSPSFLSKQKGTRVIKENSRFDIVGEFPSTKITRIQTIIDASLLDNDKRLYFLTEFLNDNRITIVELSKTIGVSTASIKGWIKRDNIPISLMYKIADRYSQRIRWRLIPLN